MTLPKIEESCSSELEVLIKMVLRLSLCYEYSPLKEKLFTSYLINVDCLVLE